MIVVLTVAAVVVVLASLVIGGSIKAVHPSHEGEEDAATCPDPTPYYTAAHRRQSGARYWS